MIIEDLLRNPLHLMMLFLVATMIFGTSKLADAGKHLGRGIKEFKKEIRSDDSPAVVASAIAVTDASSCANCGEKLPAGAKFCLSCGQAVRPAVVAHQCPTCHAEVAANARFCNSCGTAIGMVTA